MTTRSKHPEYARRYAKLHRNGYRLTVDTAVVVRIIKALQAIGYTREQIADKVGACDKRYVGAILNGKRRHIYATTQQAYLDMYAEWHLTPQDSPAAKKVITYARKRGFPPPAAWDNIADRSEHPKGVIGQCDVPACEKPRHKGDLCYRHHRLGVSA